MPRPCRESRRPCCRPSSPWRLLSTPSSCSCPSLSSPSDDLPFNRFAGLTRRLHRGCRCAGQLPHCIDTIIQYVYPRTTGGLPMYSQQDLDDAVASGVISAEAADALRAHIERQRATPIADEEQFRLITGFNDIFVSIAAAILLFAVGWIGQWFGQSVGLVIDVDGPSPLAP